MPINPLKAALQAHAHLLPRGTLRLRLARHAARRQSPAALRAAPEDPVVLAALGLYDAALAVPATDRAGRIAQAIAHAGIGEVGEAIAEAAALELSAADAMRLVQAGAPYAPALTLSLASPDRPLVRAALAIAAGQLDEAEAALRAGPQDREAAALKAAVAGARGRWADARGAIAAMFAVDDLESPLLPVDRPVSLAALGAECRPPSAAIRGPLVSVIVPVHDAAKTLDLAVNSLLAQGWRDLEVVLVDDRSGDASTAVAHRLAARDPRVRCLPNDREPGAAGARNCGIAAARGELLMFHDADDWAHPARVARHVAALERGVGSLSAHVRMDGGGVLCAPLVTPFVRHAPISLMVRRGAAQRAGPIERSRVGSDSEFLARLDLLFGRGRVTRIPDVLTVFDWDAASLSGDPQRGIGTIAGMRERRRYREAWLRRHAAMLPAMGLPLRPFRLSAGLEGRADPH